MMTGERSHATATLDQVISHPAARLILWVVVALAGLLAQDRLADIRDEQRAQSTATAALKDDIGGLKSAVTEHKAMTAAQLLTLTGRLDNVEQRLTGFERQSAHRDVAWDEAFRHFLSDTAAWRRRQQPRD
jgi:hypothetical protein